MSINRYICTGNLTRDCQVRKTQSGMAITSFGIAVNDRRKNNQTGEWEDCANFIDVTVFGRRGEAISEYLKKGTKVAIEGKLRWSQWEKDGMKRSKLEVIAEEIELLGGKPQGQRPQQQRQAQQTHESSGAIEIDSSVFDDDIPFGG